MKYIEGWSNSDNVKIHYIYNEKYDKAKVPLLVCPGLSESAEDYIKLISDLNDRRCIVLSFRGRGKSDAPKNRYTLENHISDIESVAKKLNLNEFCIMARSRGVSYALGYSILNSSLLKGMIIEEYPPVHKKMPKGWAEEFISHMKDDKNYNIKYDVLKAIEKDSVQINFEGDLNKINCPILIMKGEKEESLLSRKEIGIYVKGLKSKTIKVKCFEHDGHDVPSDNYTEFLKTIEEFLLYRDRMKISK
ncbi:alpha/beta fold hydrolase [Romboutsia weinsteinii]|nr:alpha/beta hydrolase [Romboutsia weinsteinii]